MNDAIGISKQILEYASKKGISLTHLQLQKLLYFVYGYHLAVFNKPLFPSGFAPWTYGPVSEEAYHFFKRYESNQIPPNDMLLSQVPTYIGPEENLSVSRVVDTLGNWSVGQLVDLSHTQPWQDAFNSRSPRIDDGTIQKYFRENLIKHS